MPMRTCPGSQSNAVNDQMPLNSLYGLEACAKVSQKPQLHIVWGLLCCTSAQHTLMLNTTLKILNSYSLIKDIKKAGETAASFTRVTEFFRHKPALLPWLVSQSRRWFLTSSVLVDPGSACEGGRPPGWCTLLQAYGSLDMLTASTILIATRHSKIQHVSRKYVIWWSAKEAAKYTQTSTQFSVLRARRSRPFCSLSPTPPLRNSPTSLLVWSSSSALTMGSSAARYPSHVCFKGGTGSLGKPSWCTRDLSGIWVTGLTSRRGFTAPVRSWYTNNEHTTNKFL